NRRDTDWQRRHVPEWLVDLIDQRRPAQSARQTLLVESLAQRVDVELEQQRTHEEPVLLNCPLGGDRNTKWGSMREPSSRNGTRLRAPDAMETLQIASHGVHRLVRQRVRNERLESGYGFPSIRPVQSTRLNWAGGTWSATEKSKPAVTRSQ